MASENNKLERFKHHWKNMPVHQQFDTAVGIIKNLPRDGKFSNLTCNSGPTEAIQNWGCNL